MKKILKLKKEQINLGGGSHYYIYYNKYDSLNSEDEKDDFFVNGLLIPTPYLTPYIDDCIKTLGWDYKEDNLDFDTSDKSIEENEEENNNNIISEELTENKNIMDNTTLNLKALKIAVQLLTSTNRSVELEDAIDVAERIKEWAKS